MQLKNKLPKPSETVSLDGTRLQLNKTAAEVAQADPEVRVAGLWVDEDRDAEILHTVGDFRMLVQK